VTARFDRGLVAALLRRFSDWGWVCALLAFVWFFYASTWGMFELHGSGHIGGGLTGVAMCGENCFRWNTVYPSFGWYTAERPASNQLLCSHPYGSPWLAGLAIQLLGHRDVAAALPAIVMSVATPPLLYLIGKQAWGTVAGAAASWGFACLPLTMAFSKFNNLEVLAIFGCVVMFTGQTYYQRTAKIGYLLTTLTGVVLACSGDWPAFVVIGIVLGWALLRGFVLPARMGPPHFREYARCWALTATVAVLMFSFWLVLLYRKDLIDCLLAQATRRSGPSEALDAVLRRRRTWIDLSFTPPAIFIGKLAVPVTVGRLIVRRRDEEVFALAVLVAATIQYVAFANGADVHLFWPHYFGLYYALAFAQVVATLREATTWSLQRLSARPALPAWARPKGIARTASAVGLGVIGIMLVLVLPDAERGFKYLRLSGGNYPGGPTGRDMVYVLENVVRAKLGPEDVVDLDASAELGWERWWAVAHEVADTRGGPTAQPKNSKHALWIARASKMSGTSWKAIASTAPVLAYGDVWIVDQRASPAPLDAFSLHEREPNFMERWMVASVEPMRSISQVPDEFLTWEIRKHCGQPSNRPTRPPQTVDEARIAYNAAIDAGDAATAARHRTALEREAPLAFPVTFTEGVRLLGSRILRGAQPVVELWVEVQGPLRTDVLFEVSSTILGKAPFSFIPIDPQVVSATGPPPIPSTLWRPGFIYRVTSPLFHRPGEDHLRGAWVGGAGCPKRLDGAAETELGVYP
jgi:Dolichyl-phosphate-mannose-protein mannosyltransferase